jgi:hypothetical protein
LYIFSQSKELVDSSRNKNVTYFGVEGVTPRHSRPFKCDQIYLKMQIFIVSNSYQITIIRFVMKYIFILYLFEVINVDNIFYALVPNFKSFQLYSK